MAGGVFLAMKYYQLETKVVCMTIRMKAQEQDIEDTSATSRRAQQGVETLKIATKGEIDLLKTTMKGETNALKTTMKDEMDFLKATMNGEMNALKADLNRKISSTQNLIVENMRSIVRAVDSTK